MQQRLEALHQQQQHLQEQLNALPGDQKHQALLHYQEQLEAAQRQQQQKGRRNGQQAAAATGKGSGAAAGRGKQRAAAAAASRAADGIGLGMLPAAEAAGGAAPKLVETERDRLIRIGVLTPFDKLQGFEMKVQAEAAAPAQQMQHVRFQEGRTVAVGQQHKGAQPQQHTELAAAVQQPTVQHNVPVERQPAAAKPPVSRTKASQPPAAAVDEQWALLQQRARQAGPVGVTVDVSSIPDLAQQVGRSGLPLPELMAKATQQSVEVGVTNRPRAVLMEPNEVRGRCSCNDHQLWVCAHEIPLLLASCSCAGWQDLSSLVPSGGYSHAAAMGHCHCTCDV